MNETRTPEQSMAIHQLLRLLGGSASNSGYRDIFCQVHGAFRVINWLDAMSEDVDEIWNAALSLRNHK